MVLGVFVLDAVRISMAAVGHRAFSSGSFTDKKWLMNTVVSVIAFASLSIIIQSWFSSSNHIAKPYSKAVNDVIRFAFIYLICKLTVGGPFWQRPELSEKDSDVIDYAKDAGIFIGAIALYDILLDESVSNMLSGIFEGKIQAGLTEGLKWFFVFAIHNLLTGGKFSNDWVLQTLGFAAGFAAYELAIGDALHKAIY